MGDAYARVALHRARPAVGLLSIGEEAGKGTDVVRDAHERLSSTALNFIGNVDARAIFTGVADVIVCDGFVGNVVLKAGEGLAVMFERVLRADAQADRSIDAVLERFKRRVDAEARGAAPLLGLNGLVLVAHGRSSAMAIRNAVAAAADLVRAGFAAEMSKVLTRP
jgi:glycerol-3-phosphate acyltransferase PlsX